MPQWAAQGGERFEEVLSKQAVRLVDAAFLIELAGRVSQCHAAARYYQRRRSSTLKG